MDNVREFTFSPKKYKEDIREQVGLLVVRLDDVESQAELKGLRKWLDEDSQHPDALLDAAHSWGRNRCCPNYQIFFHWKNTSD